MVTVFKNAEQINAYKQTDSNFADHVRFDGNIDERLLQKQAFISGYEYNPVYHYPELDTLAYNQKLTNKKTAIYEAVLELDAAKNAPNANIAQLELYRSYHERFLKRIMLAEAARDLYHGGTAAQIETAQEAFGQMNTELYGEYDTQMFKGMFSTEYTILDNFEPKNDVSKDLKNELLLQLNNSSIEHVNEPELLTSDELQKIKQILYERYAGIFSVIPETDDSIYYDVNECIQILTMVLEKSGLAQLGWVVIINEKKTIVATDVNKKQIKLPKNTHRNASALRRFTIHEVEVHARRGQNGIDKDSDILKNGTADYADIEEGLGILFEVALEGTFDNPSFQRARDRYIAAGLALGIDGGHPRDARETFDILWRMIAIRESKDGMINQETIAAAQDIAYSHIENAFRGTNFREKGIIYIKLKLYYEGLSKNTSYFKQNIHDINGAIDRAMIGKYNHTSDEEYRQVNSILNTPQILAEF
jgi:hypothetical protein